MSVYNQHNLIFIDETIRKYGLRGKPARCNKLLFRGERISAIVAMTNWGILDVKIVRGGVTGLLILSTSIYYLTS